MIRRRPTATGLSGRIKNLEEQRIGKKRDVLFTRIIMPTKMTAEERRLWRADLAATPVESGSRMVTHVVPWPPQDERDVDELIEGGRTVHSLLQSMQSAQDVQGLAAVMAYANRQGLALI